MMKTIILILSAWVIGLSTLGAANSQLAPFTPDADLRGSWVFRADPDLPNVLILGDSISIAYTREVQDFLAGTANVFRPMLPDGKRPVNCGETRMGLESINTWLGEKRWSVIHFNWGLWDLCYRHPESKTQGKRDKVNGTISVTLEEYGKNLEKLVERLKATGAKLVWASTTFVPEGEAGRFIGDDERYNDVARAVMVRHGVDINDLHAITKAFSNKYSAGPGDVHFTREGSEELAKRVADVITDTLRKTR
jgi:hypothetical protein